MRPPTLSVCIPTHNFGAFIGETLRGVVGQATQDMEIVVLDGASTDNTAEVVREIQRGFQNLRYQILPRKGGIDRDLESTVALARGDYCWLLSSDDVPTPGAVDRILREIEAGSEIILGNRIECDLSLVPLRQSTWLPADVDDRLFRFPSAASWREYLDAARSMGALFSYMSSIIVRREAWLQAAPGPGYDGTNYAHVARLIRILQGAGSLKYVRAPLVYCRGENDSFRRRGVIRRYLIDFHGYARLASGLFDDARIRRAFRDVVRREHRWYLLTQVRAAARRRAEWAEIRELLQSYRYSSLELLLIESLGASPLIMGVAFPLRRAHKRLRSWMARSWFRPTVADSARASR